jgi:hypothetical protein
MFGCGYTAPWGSIASLLAGLTILIDNRPLRPERPAAQEGDDRAWLDGYFADFDCRSSPNKPKVTTSEPAATATYCRPLKLYVIGEAEIG